MKIKSVLAKPFAGYIYKTIQKNKLTALADQEQILKRLLKTGKDTEYGKELGLGKVNGYDEYKQAAPIKDYEEMRPWIDKIIEGKHNVLWKGMPTYFAKTSGTTSGVKYIPITKESVGNHFGTARNAALCYAAETGNTRFFDGKLIFLSGSPELERVGGIPTGRLSGISNHLIPNFDVMIQGGVNFEPYKAKLFESIGRKVDTIELFPASEGFFAFQDSQEAEGLLLNTNDGIFYEFVPAAEIHNENPTRLSLRNVKVGENYALIINSNAGLWAYNLGDTVKFVSTNPYRLVVTGRTKHYISAFGEHVIGEEVEQSLMQAAKEENIHITEFTVAPMIQQGEGKSYHEWFIEFEHQPQDLAQFADKLNNNLRDKNIYYDDLIVGNILQPLKITPVKKSGFIDYMKSIGKLGGQNKVPRLSNDRKIAEELMKWADN